MTINWWDPDNNAPLVYAFQATGACNFEDSLKDLSGNGNNISSDSTSMPLMWSFGNGWTFAGPGITIFRVRCYPNITMTDSDLLRIVTMWFVPDWWFKFALLLIISLLLFGTLTGQF